ncbi:MAG: PKD domain-containing protein [Saprospiraceae bacterium]|nr:PKD domain-containing protein [Saprospiraceae bacterium]
MKHLLTILFFLSSLFLWGQKHEYIWTMGHKTSAVVDTTSRGGFIQFDFNHDPPLIDFDYVLNSDTSFLIYFDLNSLAMCDSSGILQFFSPGGYIYNHIYKKMEGGEWILSPSAVTGGTQQMLSIPMPGKPYRYFLMQDSVAYYWVNSKTKVAVRDVYYSIIDMSENNGAGKVIDTWLDPDVDTMEVGRMTAVKHGNGRDWWVVNKAYENKFYIYLLDHNGFHLSHIQTMGEEFVAGTGWQMFTPDGSKLIRYVATIEGNRLFIVDFDRCNGVFGAYKYKIYTPWKFGGCAVSPSGRYLYRIYNDALYQHDLWAPDPFATWSKIAEYDGFVDIFPTYPYVGALAPDGKIYWNSRNGSIYFHVIEDPDLPGKLCNYKQHAVDFGVSISITMPNYPNYRLGPLDGSPCDTLGMDNMPLAEFRVRTDSTLNVKFIDRSAYEPTDWYWTFGDGGSSTEVHPVHAYASSGTYEVCLTVSNVNGSDTYCRFVHLGTSATDDIRKDAQITVFPNPAQDILNVNIAGFYPVGARLLIYDLLGRQIQTTALSSGLQGVSVESIPPGAYVWQVHLGGDALSAGKLIVE